MPFYQTFHCEFQTLFHKYLPRLNPSSLHHSQKEIEDVTWVHKLRLGTSSSSAKF